MLRFDIEELRKKQKQNTMTEVIEDFTMADEEWCSQDVKSLYSGFWT